MDTKKPIFMTLPIWYVPEELIAIFRAIENLLDKNLKKGFAVKESELLDLISSDCRREKVDPYDVLDRFVSFYNDGVSLLQISENKDETYYSLKYPCKKARGYKRDFANARIIIEQLPASNEDSVNRIVIYEALHEYIRHKDDDASHHLFGRDREDLLEEFYADKAKRAISILKKAHIIRDAGRTTTSNKKNVASYTYSTELLESIGNKTGSIAKDQLRGQAILILSRQLAEFNTTYSPTQQDEKDRIEKGLANIDEKLKSIKIQNSQDRIVYHWYKCVLQLKLANGDMRRRIDDIITYIRYSNIRDAITEIEINKLYPWDRSFDLWDRLLQLFAQEGYEVSLPTHIEESHYTLACKRLLKDFNDLIGDDDISNVNLSVFYIRATIATIVKHPDAKRYLDRLFHYFTSHRYPYRELDICIVSQKIAVFEDDSYHFPLVAKKLLFTLKSIPETIDVIKVRISIYLRLVFLTADVKERASYIQRAFDDIELCDIEEEIIISSYLLLLCAYGELPVEEFSLKLIKLWTLTKTWVQTSENPNAQEMLANVFVLAHNAITEYTHELIDFGISVPYLACKLFQCLLELHKFKKTDWIKSATAGQLLESVYSVYKYFIGEDSLPLKYGIYVLGANSFREEWMDELCNKQLCYEEGIEYARRWIKKLDKNDISDVENILDICNIQLYVIEPLYALGHYTEAKEELSRIRETFEVIKDIYDDDDHSDKIQFIIGRYNSLMRELEMYPMTPHYFRLQYVLDQIEISNKKVAYNDFWDKWHDYVCIHKFRREYSSDEQLKEFESDEFDDILNKIEDDIAHKFVVRIPTIDGSYFQHVCEQLERRCEIQQSFILDFGGDDLSLPSDSSYLYPQFDQLFEVYKVLFLLEDKTSHPFPINRIGEKDFKQCSESQIEFYLEMCQAYCYAPYTTNSEQNEIADLYLKILPFSKNHNESSRVRTALIYCILAETNMYGDLSDLYKAEEYLYAARAELTGLDGPLINSTNAKAVFLHICFYLSEIYVVRDKENATICLWNQITNIADLPKSLDLARLMGNVADAYMSDGQSDRSQNLLGQAIDVLQSMPPTEDVMHWLSVYEEHLSE